MFKYILFLTNQIFLNYKFNNQKNINLYLNERNFYYLILHFKLSSFFYSSQLIDIFVYEIPSNLNIETKTNKNDFPIQLKKPILNESIIVYNFHLITTQQRFFIFLNLSSTNEITKKKKNWNSITSISEAFLNANWLEREASELHGIFFSGKKDVRNLMLPYGDTTAPMKKSYPCVGLREVFYDSNTDSLLQNPISLQF
uniref:Nad9 n=1 Tax=Laurentiella strenua TaxID=114681 RepID=A0A2I4PEP9_9SPIT|nr:nad9 [Laurentiella strenua]